MPVPRSGPRRGHEPDAAVIDPDVEPDPAPRRGRAGGSGHRSVVAVIALGGMLGAAARHAAALAWPTVAGGIPWPTFTVNATGCLLIGVLMVFVVEVGGTHALLRPFVGVGLLGGFTTFSTYAVETRTLLGEGRPGVAAGYVLGTVLAALLAVAVGAWLTRGGLRVRQRLMSRRGARG